MASFCFPSLAASESRILTSGYQQVLGPPYLSPPLSLSLSAWFRDRHRVYSTASVSTSRRLHAALVVQLCRGGGTRVVAIPGSLVTVILMTVILVTLRTVLYNNVFDGKRVSPNTEKRHAVTKMLITCLEIVFRKPSSFIFWTLFSHRVTERLRVVCH